MSVAALTTPRGNGRWLPLQYALREMRGGLRGFYVFIACIALGSMAIAGVGSLAGSLASGLAREGQVILGGDLAFTLIQREAKPDANCRARRPCARWRAIPVARRRWSN
jgi:putative ABC transport system permease protein